MLITLGGLLLAAVVIATAPASMPIAPSEKAWPISVVSLELGDHAPQLLLFGRIETPRTSTLGAGPESRATHVAEVNTLEGARVAKDELLVRLDDRDVRLDLALREAELETARAELASAKVQHGVNRGALARHQQLAELERARVARQSRLHDRSMMADAGLDEARRQAQLQGIALLEIQGRVDDHTNEIARRRAALALATARLGQAQLALDRSEIRAPFAGRIAAVEVSPGERVGPGTPLIEIYDMEALEVRAQVPSDRIAALRRALRLGGDRDRAVIATAQLDEQTVELQLDRLSGRVTPGRGGVDALFRVVSSGQDLELGRVVDLFVELPAEANVAAVPIEAIYGESRIYSVVDGRLKAHTVERIGERHSAEGDYQVLVRAEELVSGLLVLATQLPKAIEGLNVSVAAQP